MDELTPKSSALNNEPLNRAYDIDQTINSATDTNETILSVGLQTIDNAFLYYVSNVIKPQVAENGAVIQVPVLYASPERWKSIQVDGFFRDNKQRIVVPLIVFKRNNVAKNPDVPIDKLDANNPQLYYTIQRKYTQKNRFDNFSVLTDQAPIREYYNVVVPDYIIASYDVIIWTRYVAQLNTLIESMVFASDAYWGDKSNFRFRAILSDISTPLEINTEEDRSVKATFSVAMNGYLIPNTVNKILAQANTTLKRSLSVKKIALFTEVDSVGNDIIFTAPKNVKQPQNVSVSAPTGGNATLLVSELIQYYKIAEPTSVVPDDGHGHSTCLFLNTQLPVPATADTIGFVNGVLIEKTAVVSFTNVGTSVQLTVDYNVLGYKLASTDRITAVGSFIS